VWIIGPGGLFGEVGIFGAAGFSGSGAAFSSAVAAGFAAGGIQGGNLESAVHGAFFAAATFGIGQLASNGTITFAEKVVAHAVVGCARSVTAGGSCGSGAMAAGFSEWAGPTLAANRIDNVISRALIGAVSSRIGGGSFENGAATAAFAYLLNDLSSGKGSGSPQNLLVGQDAETAIRRYLESLGDDFRFNKYFDKDDNWFGGGRPDVFSASRHMLWEVKPDNVLGIIQGLAQVSYYTYFSDYAAGAAAPVFGAAAVLTVPGDLGTYTFRYQAGGLLLYTANYETTSNAQEFFRSLQRELQNQTNRVLAGPLPPRKPEWPGM
jgi:hypothetical protein